MRIAALQADIVWEDPPANFQRLQPWIRAAAASGARMLVLPEMYACGFSMATERVAEPVDGPSTRFLRRQAQARDPCCRCYSQLPWPRPTPSSPSSFLP